MNAKPKKTKSSKCEFCSSESTPEQCKLSTAITSIDGKEYASCCVKCGGTSTEAKPKKTSANSVKQSKK